MGKFYAVKKGRKTGIFTSWRECERSVKGFKKAIFKSFLNEDDAKDYLNPPKRPQNSRELIAYVDGSYNSHTKDYGCGCVLLENEDVYDQFYKRGEIPQYSSMRNVAGEILGSELAIKRAIRDGFSILHIYYDYNGIEKWANNKWKANQPGTIAYKAFVKNSRKRLKIIFHKVKGHSGDYYNDIADILAKRSVGLDE